MSRRLVEEDGGGRICRREGLAQLRSVAHSIAAMADDLPDLPAWAFLKEDPRDDMAFYAEARLVTHIDDGAIAALTQFYRQVLPEGGVIADLMSSWVSHLPHEMEFLEVIGHGMNAEELAANPRLTGSFLADFNLEPVLAPLPDASLDAVTICVGVQYLQQPIPVFREIARALKSGAPLVVSFSNRCFASKAVAIWLRLDLRGHASLVQRYMEEAGFDDITAHLLTDGSRCDPLVAMVGRAPAR